MIISLFKLSANTSKKKRELTLLQSRGTGNTFETGQASPRYDKA
ncbi:hypothetical protein BOVAC1_1736 [Bacteroides ovatus]|nr:hypothetical protein BOVAC1_1736 [Bacteroides ovatus]